MSAPQVIQVTHPTVIAKFDLGSDWSKSLGRFTKPPTREVPLAEILIDQEQISELHAKLVKEGDNIFIEDLGSRNGTWVRGQKLAKNNRISLRLGEPFYMGSTRVLLRMNGELEWSLNSSAAVS